MTTLFAWITDLPLTRGTVVDIAEKGGRYRWKIENEGFNRQKNSGLNLCHVYSTDPEKWKAYYYLLQIAFIIMQLLERGSLLQATGGGTGADAVATVRQPEEPGAPPVGSDALTCGLPEESFDPQAAGRLKIHLNSS